MDSIKRRLIKDKIFKWLVTLFTCLIVVPLGLIVFELIRKGFGQINFNFFTQTAPNTFEAMTAISQNKVIPGGIVHGILGSIEILAIASLIAIPIGLFAGIYLSENQEKRLATVVREVTEILQGIPSIVLGIIGYVWIVKNVTHGFSALAASIPLAIMMLPLIIRSTEETLKMIPSTIKEAGLALGVPYHKVMFKIIVPCGFSGIFTGILLSISRIMGETAPLMMTALGSTMINFDVTKPTSAVPLLIWEFYNDPNLISLIWSASLFLMMAVLLLNIGAKQISKRWQIQ